MPPRKKKAETEEEQDVQTSAATQETEPVSRAPNEDILTLSDQERGFTRDTGEDVKWNYLAAAMRRHIILTGVVSGIEMATPSIPLCIVDYEGIRIVIPGREVFMDEWLEDTPPPVSFQVRLNRILGATVDFMLAGVDLKNHAAVGSRRRALVQLQKRYYETKRVKEGILVACRVIGVGNNRVTVEALGVDTEIPASEVSWEWFSDVCDLYAPGDLVVARVKSVEQTPDSYAVQLSIKAASANPEPKAAGKLIPGSNYFGVVTGVGNRMIFIRLQAGVNVKTTSYSMKEPPHKLDTVSFHVQWINAEKGTVGGIITRVIKKNKLR